MQRDPKNRLAEKQEARAREAAAWASQTDEELVTLDYPEAPTKEMMRRLKDSLEVLDDNLSSLKESVERGQEATNRLTWVLIILTIAILLLTAVMAAPIVRQIFNYYFSTNP